MSLGCTKENNKGYKVHDIESDSMVKEENFKCPDFELVLFNKWNLKHHYNNWKQKRRIDKLKKEGKF